MLKFDASIFGGELPVGLGVVGIAVVLPGGDFVDEGLFVGNTAIEARSNISVEAAAHSLRNRRRHRGARRRPPAAAPSDAAGIAACGGRAARALRAPRARPDRGQSSAAAL